ncbi:hypothetical protein GCM10009425_46470 [Pseudomonas asuensis]|uniref:Transposase n=1 Tax=Pseudomonas asuensis TaxID=1825787 RepID=A0ABQ2H2Z5_9PSED|nr:hypothetical protein GCM10009425_46470 [Pseudomonas asuensis]
MERGKAVYDLLKAQILKAGIDLYTFIDPTYNAKTDQLVRSKEIKRFKRLSPPGWS